MQQDSPVNKYTLKEWVRHPTTIMLIVAVNLVWVLILVVVNMGKDQSADCMEQVSYLRERVVKLERQLDEYTTAMIFKNGQIKVRDNVIDSLKKEKQ